MLVMFLNANVVLSAPVVSLNAMKSFSLPKCDCATSAPVSIGQFFSHFSMRELNESDAVIIAIQPLETNF